MPANGRTIVPVTAYMKKWDNNYYAVGSSSYAIFREAPSQYTLEYGTHGSYTVNIGMIINNWRSYATGYDIQLIIKSGTKSYTRTASVSQVASTGMVSQTLNFDFSGVHVIDEANDLFTIEVKESAKSTYTTYCSDVAWSYFPAQPQ